MRGRLKLSELLSSPFAPSDGEKGNRQPKYRLEEQLFRKAQELLVVVWAKP